MEYQPSELEAKWRNYWRSHQVYRTQIDPDKPKFYILDMFPYPSGAGLHVGHPLGYIASDIVARYKRLKGYNVLHPMGFDSFGLPAEQYAIETGQHPALTTEQNIATYKAQLNKIGFSYDWEREIRTSDPGYYRWTQWIFQQLFQSWYNYQTDRAEDIQTLIQCFEKQGNSQVNAACHEDTPVFSAEDWKRFSEQEKEEMLLRYRLTYLDDSMVNWCPALGTVLANDEIKDGFSERGGHPVERKQMKQWSMRITAYAERLLNDLDTLEWSLALKEMQRNWIGKSHGAEMDFVLVQDAPKQTLTCFTTRPDTIFGVTFLVMAPEHELALELATPEQYEAVASYIAMAKNRSERERQAEVKQVSGVFTGSYVINPISGEAVQLWIADYVLAGYGTGVVMAVPSSDDRDFRFAQHFGLPILPVIEGTENLADPTEIKRGRMINSGFLNGLETEAAIAKVIERAEALGKGRGKVNYRLRDAVFSRQRYWGEPVPVYFENGIPRLVPQKELPLVLPEIDAYKPTPEGEPPLGRATDWAYQGKHPYELTTMPGWAGSSWYFLRYMDPKNDQAFVSSEAVEYWGQVDFYIGGTEHAVGHLLYSRFWTKFLYDRGYLPFHEPFKKLVNQGMIQGRSSLIHRIKNENVFVSADLQQEFDTATTHVWINCVKNDVLDIEAFKKWKPDVKDARFICSPDGKFYCEARAEKMSKSKYNVINPDDFVAQYSADTLRLYEMFLGPLETAKPWDTSGTDGVHRFLRKLWRLFFDKEGNFSVSQDAPTAAEQKALHQTIKKINQDIERGSYNTCVSAFMVCVNELAMLACNKRQILEPLLILLAPFAPHISEELWHRLDPQRTTDGQTIFDQTFPDWDEQYLKEDQIEYPVSINGKVRAKIAFPAEATQADIQPVVLADERVLKWTEGKALRKFVFVPKRMINVVV
ncbi:MAG: leucine--tRNA ligase [Bernardetiaceae bacterium]